jgi:AcrR family transcriptional regulator
MRATAATIEKAAEDALTGRDLQREETRRRLRDAALDVYRRDGFATARIDDIARAVGVSRGTFYFHFPAKEDVLADLLREAEANVARAVERVPSSAPIKKSLEALCVAFAKQWENERELFPEVGGVALRRAAATLRKDEVSATHRALAVALGCAIDRRELSRHFAPDTLADMYLINVFAATLAWCARPDFPLVRALAAATELFLEGARQRRR